MKQASETDSDMVEIRQRVKNSLHIRNKHKNYSGLHQKPYKQEDSGIKYLKYLK